MSKPEILALEEKINEHKRKVLWENSNASDGMNADAIINLSSDDYDELVWFFIFSNGSSNLKNQQSTICRRGNTVTLYSIGYSSNSTVRRTIEYISDTQYKASIGKRDSDDDANCCIPVAVVGIKY